MQLLLTHKADANHCDKAGRTAIMLAGSKGYLGAVGKFFLTLFGPIEFTGLRRAVGNVSGNRCASDCRSRGGEFDPGLVLYFCGNCS